ncbi:uncharacterized protein LOC114528449 [Dendronephthya gigantea]|uniref:uncharacterized protein LOC114528449 n=1 Tax=Dendronephthya gigantea TaxID=151771 RepID=UPI00106C2012|nr:uncharacterized protein LOC114528449 [Dendronephthya gigantea]
MSSHHLVGKILSLLLTLGLLQICLSSPYNDPYHTCKSRGKPVTQSSTEGTHDASLATDGNYEQNDDKECAMTTVSNTPYLLVDLGNDIFINFVVFILSKSSSSYSNIKITFSNTQEGPNLADGKIETIKNIERKSPRRNIRYIRISREESSTQLKVCEIAAYTLPHENLAQRKRTKTYKIQSYGGPYRAVDLDMGTQLKSKTYTRPWLRIDLQDVYFVHEVLVFASTGKTNIGTMHHVNIRIGSSTELLNNPVCTTATLHVGEGRSFYCDMFGQIIFIHREGLVSLFIAEVLVNTNNGKSVEAIAATRTPGAESSGKEAINVFSLSLKTWYVSESVIQEKKIRIELAGQFNIAMIYIVATTLLQFTLKLGLNTNPDLQSDCIPGRHDMPNIHETRHFVCTERILTKYIHLHQYNKETKMQILSVFAFEETRPEINYETTNRHVWLEEGKDASLSCDINAYPAPVFSWVKNKKRIAYGSSTLTLRHVRQNQSGDYECWGNNTIGYNAMLMKVQVSSKLRVCTDQKEKRFDFITSSTATSFKIMGHEWYSFYDEKQMKYGQFEEKAPKSPSPDLPLPCQLWLSGTHPRLEDGIVSRKVCLKNTTNDCAETYDVDITRCAAYYTYHFPNLRKESSHYKFCFAPSSTIALGQSPAISHPSRPNHALHGKTFKTELEVTESYHCLAMCQLHAQCKSFNFSKKYKICELNTSTRKEFPKNYLGRSRYSYFPMDRGIVHEVGL